jgi:hypothetical protein
MYIPVHTAWWFLQYSLRTEGNREIFASVFKTQTKIAASFLWETRGYFVLTSYLDKQNASRDSPFLNQK